jgi:hypothetical protein
MFGSMRQRHAYPGGEGHAPPPTQINLGPQFRGNPDRCRFDARCHNADYKARRGKRQGPVRILTVGRLVLAEPGFALQAVSALSSADLRPGATANRWHSG